MKHLLPKYFFIVSIFLLQSCRDDYNICTLPRDVKFSAGFYKKTGASEVAIVAPNLNIYTLNSSTYIYQNQNNASTFALPLNPVSDTSKFVIRVENTLQADTMSIIYTSRQVLLSPECGNVTYYSLVKILTTTNTIDSVKITNSEVLTVSNSNAKVYF